MKCPVCLTPDLVMADRQGIEIDYCPQCRGVWLDRGELDKILERSHTPAGRPQPESRPQSEGERFRGYEQRGYQERGGEYRGEYPRHHRKKNWLEEIFD